MKHTLKRTVCVFGLAAGLIAGPAIRAQQAPTYINFSYDGVEIGLVVKAVGEITGKQFVIDDSVKGKISIITPPRTAKEEVYPLFLSSLESSGYSVVVKGKIHHIVKLPERAVPGAPVLGASDVIPTEGMATKIFAIQHIGVAELRKVLEPLVGGGKEGALAAVNDTNHLLVTDTAASLIRLQQIIKELDKPRVVAKDRSDPTQTCSIVPDRERDHVGSRRIGTGRCIVGSARAAGRLRRR